MICAQCGKEFKPHGRQRICPRCKPAKAPVIRACKQCGQPFHPKCGTQLFCSRECYKAGKRKSRIMRQVRRVICPVCGKTYETLYDAKYCSPKCRMNAHRKSGCTGGPNRELTPTSIYLIHKDHAMGMSLESIADLYHRSRESVQRALDTPLPPEQEQAIHHFASHHRGA